MALLLACAALAAGPDLVTVRPPDTGVGLVNPGMGWVFHYYDNVPTNYGSKLAPSDTVDEFPGLSVVYLRIPWSYLEPVEGQFNWSVLDSPAARWVAKGKQVALRLSCCESWTRWATPAWVAAAGAKGYNFKPGKEQPDGPYWEPDYDDPIFLEKLDHFLAALAARYDGNPEIAFIDVGSFGVWGEGHLWASTQRKYPAATVIRHIDLHLKNFRRSLLAANDDFVFQGQEAIDYAERHGLTLRDDSILVQQRQNAYFHAAMAQPFWPTRPVILESEHYGGSRDRGCWGDGSLYLKAVEEYHASYVSIHWWPREFLNECRPLIDRINQRLGYRLQLVEASWPSRVPVGGAFTLASAWRNAGVAPCLPGGYAAWTLTDARGGLAAVFVDEGQSMATLPVGAPGAAETKPHATTFTLPYNLPAGTYDVWVSVGNRTGTPKLALPLAGESGLRYKLGQLVVSGDYDVRVTGDGARLELAWDLHTAQGAGVGTFAHLERDGKIVWHGTLAAANFGEPGTVKQVLTLDPPEAARGQRFTLLVGLWRPDRLGQPDERLRPDRDQGDKRVRVGTVSVDAAGGVKLER